MLSIICVCAFCCVTSCFIHRDVWCYEHLQHVRTSWNATAERWRRCTPSTLLSLPPSLSPSLSMSLAFSEAALYCYPILADVLY